MAIYRGQEDFTGAAALDVSARTVAANAALTISASDSVIILLNSSDAATKAATITVPTALTFPSLKAGGGPNLRIILKARSSTGSYTIACTNAGVAGTVTLDAALEGADFVWINGVLNLFNLLGTATFA